MLVSGRLRVGLTGGIGSGKSTVAALLRQHGAAVIDTDAIARSLSAPGGAAIASIREVFGPEFIDTTGALDRPRMRALVFSDPSAKRRLEAILHPLIGVESEAQATAATAPVLVFEVPLLAESTHWRARVDKVLVVDCPEQVQLERVMARAGWTQAAVQAVMALQASRPLRRAVADAVIFNAGIDLGALSRQVLALVADWFPSEPPTPHAVD